jgi:hypothetical protein
MDSRHAMEVAKRDWQSSLIRSNAESTSSACNPSFGRTRACFLVGPERACGAAARAIARPSSLITRGFQAGTSIFEAHGG